MVPTEGFLIASMGWQLALVVLGGAALLMIPGMGFAWSPIWPIPGRAARTNHRAGAAGSHALPSFQMLMAGYFVCGFQVVFIGVHMPSYLMTRPAPQVASYALALIGVLGTHASSAWATALAQAVLILAFIYLARLVAIMASPVAPLTPP